MKVWLSLTLIEFIATVLATGIVVNEIVFTQTLSMTEFALVMFLFGYVASSIADREGTKGPIELIRAIGDVFSFGGRNR